MRLRILKRLVVRVLRQMGVVATRLQSSPEGRFKTLLRTYQIDTVLDVGANIGQFAIMIRCEAKFDGDLLSFEPMQREFAELQRAAHSDPRWLVFNYGLGDTNSQMTINVAGNSASSSLLPASPRLFNVAPQAIYTGTQTVQVRTLDAVYDELSLAGRRTYLKIDAQGFEVRILTGAEHALRHIDTVQLELPLVPIYEGALLFDEFLPVMHGMGYRLVHLVPGFFDRSTGELLEVDGIFHRFRDIDEC